MSIATTAPRKFAFQDMVCVEMVLRFSGEQSTTLYVEPDGGEDAELAVVTVNGIIRHEIQVKGAEGQITLADVASCLAHTPPRRHDQTLLERLVGDPQRTAVLVMSGRADDASAVYVADRSWKGAHHPQRKLSRAHAKAFLKAFAVADVAGGETGVLKAARQAHNAAFATSTDPATVQEALRRVIILEQVNEVELDARCAEQLRRDHSIPTDRVADMILQLRAAIAVAKLQKTDAVTLLRSIIAQASPPAIRPIGYVKRGVETDLVQSLLHNNVLLLSGTPRVGKTFAARWVAAEFIPHGYDIREFSDVESAERFLLEPGSALRLALLDDPLGGSTASAEAGRALTRLERLIGRRRPQRKLLVSQGLEPLLTTARVPSLDSVTTGNQGWRDMSALASSFLVEIWRSLASTFNVDTVLGNRVADALVRDRLILEPGCLEHLAANVHRLRSNSSLDEIVRLAREDAAQLGRALAADGFENLSVGVALTTTAQEPISLTELGYVRGGGGPGLPGKTSDLHGIISIGGPALPPTPAPAYDEPPQISEGDKKGLDALERRRLIAIDAESGVGFTHPFYRAAAETLASSPTHHFAQSIVEMLERGLFCLSPRTSRATARNLDWIFDRLEPREDSRSKVVEHAVEGLRSCFPATRDLCFRFLVRRLNDIPARYREALPDWIASVASIRLADLEWNNGEAHLPFGERSGTDYLNHILHTVEREDVATDLAVLDAPGGGTVTPERAARVLRFFASERTGITSTIAGRLLSFDEAALRAETIRIWLSDAREGEDVVLERIFSDDHPSCAVAALIGTIRGWHACSSSQRQRRLDGLASIANNVVIAVPMLDRLVLFDREEVTGDDPPWPIFERLLPIVMNVLPHNAEFIDARLFSVARSVVGQLPPPSIVAICDRWIDWLERNEREGSLPSEFSLSVTEILLKATAKLPALRAGRIDRLLGFSGTGASITFLADMIDNWTTLLDSERVAVLNRLKSGRSDDLWLQAVALTRSIVPDQICEQLLPMINLAQPAETLLASIRPDLLVRAVHVYTGRPQPLWWLGTHHAGEDVWEPVVETLARRPDHQLFELAWDNIAYSCDGERVARIIADVGATAADRMFEILLRLKVAWNGNFMPEAWSTLLRLATDATQYGRWLDRMAEAAPAILNNLGDLKLWLSEEQDRRAMLDQLKGDFVPVEMARVAFAHAEGIDVSELQQKAIQVLDFFVRESPPQLFGTCDQLLALLNGADGTAELTAALSQRREMIFAERRTIDIAMKQPDPPLVGWNAP